jgi:hypothetical protein
MLHRKRLRDESAHRPSQDVCALEAQHIDHARAIIGELADIEGRSVIRGTADTAVVEED